MEAAGGRAEHGDGMDAVVVTSTDRTTAEKGEGGRERALCVPGAQKSNIEDLQSRTTECMIFL